MAVTPINSEDRLVQATFAKHLEKGAGLGQHLCLERGDLRAGWHPRPCRYQASSADPRSAVWRWNG